jgi:hypothetical protein
MNVLDELVEELKGDHLIDASSAAPRNIPTNAACVPASSSITETVDGAAVLRRQRAEDDVASMQLIEQVFDGIESETVRSESALANHLNAKKALAAITQFNGSVGDPELTQAESVLANELKEWRAGLESRGARIDAARLRLFCENSRPALSPKALIALGGLYRTAELSDGVRDKFDFVMTRLFSCETDEVRREARFGRGEAVDQIKKLYKKWAAEMPEQPAAEREYVREAVAKFGSFVERIQAAPTFVELFRTDLPASIREFKRSLGERMFEPEIMASVLECNIAIGNRFVEIAACEKKAYGQEAVRSKYGEGFDQVATESAVRTLRLVALLENHDLEIVEARVTREHVLVPAAKKQKKERRTSGFSFFGINKWLLGATFAVVVLGIGMYSYGDVFDGSTKGIQVAKDVDLSTSDVGSYFSKGRASESTLYVVASPEWESLSKDAQKATIQKALAQGRKNGMKSVQILNGKGQSIAYASDTRMDINAK